MNKLTYYTSMFILFSAACFLGLLFYWYLYPHEPIKFYGDMKILNENDTIKQGDLIILKVSFDKKTKITPIVHRKIVDGVIYDVGSVVSIKNDLGLGENIGGLEVPHSILEGIYHLEYTACYQMNPIREVCVDYQSEEFQVIK